MDVAKSVSVLHGLGDPAVSVVVEEVFTASVVETVGAVRGWVAYGQRGHQGDGRLAGRAPTSGLFGVRGTFGRGRRVDGVGDAGREACGCQGSVVGGWGAS